jgi:hypothetical protein
VNNFCGQNRFAGSGHSVYRQKLTRLQFGNLFLQFFDL